MPKNAFTCDCHAVNHTLVKQVQSNMPEEGTFSALSDFYKVMADPTRCKLIFALCDQEMCVCDLANLLSMTKSAISHQLSKMRRHGVVTCRRAGKEVYYSLDDDHVKQIFSLTMAHVKECSCEK